MLTCLGVFLQKILIYFFGIFPVAVKSGWDLYMDNRSRKDGTPFDLPRAQITRNCTPSYASGAVVRVI